MLHSVKQNVACRRKNFALERAAFRHLCSRVELCSRATGKVQTLNYVLHSVRAALAFGHRLRDRDLSFVRISTHSTWTGNWPPYKLKYFQFSLLEILCLVQARAGIGRSVQEAGHTTPMGSLQIFWAITCFVVLWIQTDITASLLNVQPDTTLLGNVLKKHSWSS